MKWNVCAKEKDVFAVVVRHSN